MYTHSSGSNRIVSVVLAIVIAITCAFAILTAAPEDAHAATPYSKHGVLKVSGKHLVSKKTGKVVKLKGVSTHGINWDVGYPFVNKSAFKTLRDKYKVNCIRLAMYTTEYFGYCDKCGAQESQSRVRQTLLNRIDTGVRAASELGMYVIIDWHVLNDQTPKKYQSLARSFFSKVAKKYAKHNNVIYEICNEPNGGTSWSTIKSYAKSVIPVIRKYDKNAIVICGTPNWSQDVDIAAKSPLTYKNVLYAVHFYAATHQEHYRDKVRAAYQTGLPVFCSEFNICDASGYGSLNKAQGSKWLKLLDSYKIGYCAWSLSNKNESCSLLKSSTNKTSGWTTAQLSASGKWILGKYKNG